MPYADPVRRKAYHSSYSHSWKILNKARFNEVEQKRRRENKEWIYHMLEMECCRECGETYTPALEYHHRDRNTKKDHVFGGIRQMAGYGAGRDKILNEIKKCDVLCFSCHVKKNLGRHKEWGLKNKIKKYPIITSTL